MITELHKRRLRRDVLFVLHEQRINEHDGWVGGQLLEDIVRAPLLASQQTPSQEELLGLCRDLKAAGYLNEEDMREFESEPFGLHALNFKATDKGLGFIRGTEPADPDIHDGRIVR